VDVPMLVILVGAIGGMIFSGIVGLFTGAVVLALGYTLIQVWINDDLSEKANEAKQAE
jgi:predicted PurR-regulated permease PerM